MKSMLLAAIMAMGRIWPDRLPMAESLPLADRVRALRGFWKLALLFSLAVGGIYLGWFSPTEAAAVGAFAAIVGGVAVVDHVCGPEGDVVHRHQRRSAMGRVHHVTRELALRLGVHGREHRPVAGGDRGSYESRFGGCRHRGRSGPGSRQAGACRRADVGLPGTGSGQRSHRPLGCPCQHCAGSGPERVCRRLPDC